MIKLSIVYDEKKNLLNVFDKSYILEINTKQLLFIRMFAVVLEKKIKKILFEFQRTSSNCFRVLNHLSYFRIK